MTETKARPSVVEALAAAKSAIGAVGKTGRNQQQGYNFRGVDAVVNAAAPELNKAGVIVVPMLQSIDYDTVETGKNRTPMAHVRVMVTYRFHGPAGDYIDATVPGESMDSGDKAAPKAMSVAYRIALLQALNLPTDEADPDEKSYERSPRSEQAPANSSSRQQRPRQQAQAKPRQQAAAREKPKAGGNGDSAVTALRSDIWHAATQLGMGTVPAIEEDFAKATGGLDIAAAPADELRAYLGLLNGRLDEAPAPAEATA